MFWSYTTLYLFSGTRSFDLIAIVYFCMFRNNRITAEGAVYLAKGLMVNTSLQILKVGQCNTQFFTAVFRMAKESTSHPG